MKNNLRKTPDKIIHVIFYPYICIHDVTNIPNHRNIKIDQKAIVVYSIYLFVTFFYIAFLSMLYYIYKSVGTSLTPYFIGGIGTILFIIYMIHDVSKGNRKWRNR